MTRAEIRALYDTANGRIVSPGKFEGQPIYAPHFWERVLNGGADEEVTLGGTPHNWLTISDDDRAQFPELTAYPFTEPGTDMIVISESDDGFVTCLQSDASELQAAQAEESADALNDEVDAL